jgi:hypothetical protein
MLTDMDMAERADMKTGKLSQLSQYPSARADGNAHAVLEDSDFRQNNVVFVIAGLTRKLAVSVLRDGDVTFVSPPSRVHEPAASRT